MVDFYNELFGGESYNGANPVSESNNGLDYDVLPAIEELGEKGRTG